MKCNEAFPLATEAMLLLAADTGIPRGCEVGITLDVPEKWRAHFEALEQAVGMLKDHAAIDWGVTDPDLLGEPALEVFVAGESTSMDIIMDRLNEVSAGLGTMASELLNELFDGELVDFFMVRRPS